MAFPDRLRRAHEVATMMTRQLRDLVHRHRPGDDGIAIATQLARLLGVMRVHLADEETFFYSALIATRDPVAEPLARRFRAETGALAWELEEFMRLWSSSAVIALDFAAFQVALDRLLSALELRIAHENATLYEVAFEVALDRLLGALEVRIARENATLYKVADALIAEPRRKTA